MIQASAYMMGHAIHHILLVENIDADADLLRRAFAAEDRFLVSTARTLAEAWAVLEEHPTDLVLASSKLPDGPGAALLTRDHPRTGCPTILLTCESEQTCTEPAEAGEALLLPKSEHVFATMPLITRLVLREWDQRQERTTLEKQLFQLKKVESIGRLVGGVVHDFNNLLAAIIGYTQLGAATLQPDEPLKQDLDEVLKAADRAATLTRQLLLFSHKQVTQPSVIDLARTLEGMKKMLRRLIPQSIQIAFESTGPAPVLADPAQMEQVLMNLALNARDGMADGGLMTFRIDALPAQGDQEHAAEATTQVIQLSVSDTGPGTESTAPLLDHLGEGEEGQPPLPGLSTVSRIVSLHKGKIAVESIPQKGTTIQIHLPAARATEDAMTLPTTAETIRSGQTILLVEDDEQLRLLAGRILQSHGYQVIMARTGAEALFVSERHEGPIHLLLSDVVMPHMKGTEMALRLTRQRPDMAILLMSGHPEDTLGIGPGVPFIQKPFTPDGLLRRVATVLADTAPKV